MFMEKPSCIKELKQLASTLAIKDAETLDCISRVKQVVNNNDLSPMDKIIKLKEICREHGK